MKKPKKVPAVIKLWKIVPYKDSKIWIRQYGDSLFEYLVLWRNEIYADNIIITPQEGKTKLSPKEKYACFQLIFASATTTVDTIRGEQATEAQQQHAKEVMDIVDSVQKPTGKKKSKSK